MHSNVGTCCAGASSICHTGIWILANLSESDSKNAVVLNPASNTMTTQQFSCNFNCAFQATQFQENPLGASWQWPFIPAALLLANMAILVPWLMLSSVVLPLCDISIATFLLSDAGPFTYMAVIYSTVEFHGCCERQT